MRRALLVAALAAGCTRTEPAANPPPAATAKLERAAPDMALKELCNTPPPAEVTAKIARDKRYAALCLELIKVVSAGQKPDRAALAPLRLDSPPLAGVLDDTALALARCRAVATDSDGPCDAAGSDERKDDCRGTRAEFHAARSTTDSAWRFPDTSTARCRKAGLGSACEAARDAIRAGKPALCPHTAELADCPAVAASDPSKCKSGDCRKRTRFLQLVAAGGLQKVASDGEGADKALAGAALGRKDACDAPLTALGEACRSLGNTVDRDGGL